MQVEQIDRDAAAKALGYGTWEDATDYRNSSAAFGLAKQTAEAFAAHRAAERDRMIEALRQPDAAMVEAVEVAFVELGEPFSGEQISAALSTAADHMERGA